MKRNLVTAREMSGVAASIRTNAEPGRPFRLSLARSLERRSHELHWSVVRNSLNAKSRHQDCVRDYSHLGMVR